MTVERVYRGTGLLDRCCMNEQVEGRQLAGSWLVVGGGGWVDDG